MRDESTVVVIAMAPVTLVMGDGSLVLTKQEAVKRHVLALRQMPGAGTSIKLPIGMVTIGARIIPEDSQMVTQLATSIRRTRQVTPILVRRISVGYGLIDGLNRISALKRLGETEVLATVLDVTSDDEATACEAISNSHRRQKLTALDRALTDFAAVKYVEKMVSQVAIPSGGKQPKEKYHAKTARELGVSPDQIARSCKIAKIFPYVQRAIRQHDLEDNQRALLEIAGAGDDVQAQTHMLVRILNRIETSKAASKLEEGTLAPAAKSTKLSSSPPLRSDTSGPSMPVGSNSNGMEARSLASNKDDSVQRRDASLSHTQPEPQDKQTATGFDVIKQEWEKTGGLLSLLLEVAQDERQRFFDECLVPIFPELLRMTVAKASM